MKDRVPEKKEERKGSEERLPSGIAEILTLQGKGDIRRKQKVIDDIIDRVAVLDKAPMANLIHKQLEATKLRNDWDAEVTVIEDRETGDFFIETEIPPVLTWNEKTQKLTCEDAATAKLVQLASGGDPVEIKRICEDKEVRLKILSDDNGQIRFKLMAHLLERAMKDDGARIDPVRHMLNMIQDEKGGRERDAHGRYTKLTPANKWSDDRGQATEGVRREILGLEKASGKVRKKQT